MLVVGDVGFVPGDGDFDLLAAATRRARVFAGYAGWGPGQLEAELEESSWIVEASAGPTSSPSRTRTSGARSCAARAASTASSR